MGHCDIKPENIIFSSDEQIVLTDFRVSKMFIADQDATNKIVGSIRFQPPEVLLGASKDLDEMKMDMWSAGVTLFMMLTKKYPYNLQNISECLS